MSCNCNCKCNNNTCGKSTVVIVPTKKTTKVPIHQLKDNGENIYPNTVIKAIHDSRTGESLETVLSKTNHLYLTFRGNFADTVEEVPEEYRHEGLVVTFTNCRGEIKHKMYKGVSKNNCSFTSKDNWTDFLSVEDTTDKAPSNLRFEGTTLKLDVVNKEGTAIETLSAQLPNNSSEEDKWYKNTSLTLNGNTLELVQTSNTGKECKKTLDLTPLLSKIKPGFKAQVSPTVPTVSNAEPGVIYVVPNAAVPGTAREYILVESPLGRYIEQLGSASGMCSILNEKLDGANQNALANDNRLLRAVLEDKVLKLTVGNNTTEQEVSVDLSPILPQIEPTDPVDLSPITQRLDALESKQDKDTIYNDAPIKGDINTLKEKVKALEDKGDKDTIFDPTSINNRLTALEGKQDNDTIYDDSELRRRIITLEARPIGGTGTAYDDTEVKRRLTTLEQKQDKDTVYDDTQLSNRVRVLEGKTDANTFPTNLEVLDTETPSTKKIKITLNDNKPALEANINIPQPSAPTTNESFIVFLTQGEYDTKLAQGSLDVKKLYVIVPQVD